MLGVWLRGLYSYYMENNDVGGEEKYGVETEEKRGGKEEDGMETEEKR